MIDTINKAKARRNIDQPLIIHSDRGSHYVATEYKKVTENTNIKNSVITEIITEFKKSENELNDSGVKFSIDFNYNVMIENNKKKNKKKISNFKKDVLPKLKINSDFFYDYHKIILDFIAEKKKIKYYDVVQDETYYPIDNNSLNNKINLTNTCLINDNLINDNLINEILNDFKNNLVYDNNIDFKNNLVCNNHNDLIIG